MLQESAPVHWKGLSFQALQLVPAFQRISIIILLLERVLGKNGAWKHLLLEAKCNFGMICRHNRVRQIVMLAESTTSSMLGCVVKSLIFNKSENNLSFLRTSCTSKTCKSQNSIIPRQSMRCYQIWNKIVVAVVIEAFAWALR